MKKLFIGLFSILFCSLGFAQEAWENSVGISLSAPYYSLQIRDEGNKDAFVPSVSARYFGFFEKGFCVDTSLGVGLATSEDFKLEAETGTSKGLAMNLTAGAGYNFSLSERWSISILGNLTLDWMQYRFLKEIKTPVSTGYATSEWTQSDNSISFGIGAKFLAQFKASEHIAIFASASAGFWDAGSLWIEGTKYGNPIESTSEIRGNFFVTPSLGVSWIF